ncbi:MAG: helix-turn-helix transcriptional regulator [Proteobacteria bacterium]|nr:helix-turn-helix transcriptional regulator [Pseudomonadota bacterium]
MTPAELKAGRLAAGLTQVRAARRLGVSQPYLSQLEAGTRPIAPQLAEAATALYRLPATALPLPATGTTEFAPDRLAQQLAGLGYPGFAHLRGRKANPATVLLAAVGQRDLDVRLAEALPWVALAYPELDWNWLVREAKLLDAQNRLGFVVELARDLAATTAAPAATLGQLSAALAQLEAARLAVEGTLCRESMPPAEREWLAAHRSASARHWNLLTGLTAEHLDHAA